MNVCSCGKCVRCLLRETREAETARVERLMNARVADRHQDEMLGFYDLVPAELSWRPSVPLPRRRAG